MPFAATGRFARTLVGALVLTLAAPARAGDKPLSSGIMIPFNSGDVTTTCSLLNVGTKPIRFSSTAVLIGPQGETVASEFDSCTEAPLPAMTACSFGGGGGVFGGGTAFVKGSPKSLRGNCRIADETGTVLQVLPMR